MGEPESLGLAPLQRPWIERLETNDYINPETNVVTSERPAPGQFFRPEAGQLVYLCVPLSNRRVRLIDPAYDQELVNINCSLVQVGNAPGTFTTADGLPPRVISPRGVGGLYHSHWIKPICPTCHVKGPAPAPESWANFRMRPGDASSGVWICLNPECASYETRLASLSPEQKAELDDALRGQVGWNPESRHYFTIHGTGLIRRRRMARHSSSRLITTLQSGTNSVANPSLQGANASSAATSPELVV